MPGVPLFFTILMFLQPAAAAVADFRFFLVLLIFVRQYDLFPAILPRCFCTHVDFWFVLRQPQVGQDATCDGVVTLLSQVDKIDLQLLQVEKKLKKLISP